MSPKDSLCARGVCGEGGEEGGGADLSLFLWFLFPIPPPPLGLIGDGCSREKTKGRALDAGEGLSAQV